MWFVDANVYGEKLSDGDYLPKYVDLILSFNDGDDANNALVRRWSGVELYANGFFSTRFKNDRVYFEAHRNDYGTSSLAYEDKELTLLCNY